MFLLYTHLAHLFLPSKETEVLKVPQNQSPGGVNILAQSKSPIEFLALSTWTTQHNLKLQDIPYHTCVYM